jgi:hypothetical protein
MFRRNYVKIAVLFLVLTLALPTFANRRAKVLTESGKKWDVLFLKMSDDTIFLKAFKPNGDMFNISGHKSKFKKVEFTDGTSLDFSLSDFPAAEKTPRSNEGGWKDTFPLANQFEGESLEGKAASSTAPLESKSGIIDHQNRQSAVPVQQQMTEKKPDNSVIKTGAEQPQPVVLPLEKPQTTQPAVKTAQVIVVKKKGRGLGLSLCILSAASLAGSGALYFLYHKDHDKEEQTFADLDRSAVKGPGTIDLLSQNKSYHEAAQRKLTYSQVLLGIGAATLTADIIFYF